jgi:hypothetical protein
MPTPAIGSRKESQESLPGMRRLMYEVKPITTLADNIRVRHFVETYETATRALHHVPFAETGVR